MNIESHLLAGGDVSQVECLNAGGEITPRFLVFHYTAGRDLDSSVRSLCTRKPSGNASAHLVVGRDGKVVQLVPFNREAWHAGVSAWRGATGLNRCSIGIELDNAGRLQRAGSRYLAWFGAAYPEDEVIVATHKHERADACWHAYTEAQIAVARELADLLVAAYRLEDVVGHDDIAPGRKSDPGPAFPLDSIRSRVLGRGDASPRKYRVTADLLNIRAGAGSGFPPVAPPLPEGAIVAELEAGDQWYRVQVVGGSGVQGWVSSRFVAPVP